MIIPKGEAFIALFLSALVILGTAQLVMPPGVQFAYAQTTACAVADVAEPANLAITVNYLPNAAAFPAEKGLEVQRQLNGGAWSSLPNLPPNSRSFVDSSIVQGNVDNTYSYRVRVLNVDGTSGWSEIGCKTIKRILRVPPTPVLVVS